MEDEELVRRIERIKQEYLDCGLCPPERNCCLNFGGGYSATFPAESATLAWGKDTVESLVKRDKLTRVGGNFRLHDEPCPIVEEGLCPVHEQKEALKFYCCLNFPFAVADYHVVAPEGIKATKAVVVDYRCYCVERDFDLFLPALIDIRGEGIQVYVRAYHAPGFFTGLELREFVGRILELPSQKMHMKG
jgi:hypothetical protein